MKLVMINKVYNNYYVNINNLKIELVLLAQYIQRIQQESKCLNGCYAGEKETEIKQKEMDVLTSWKLLQQFVDQQKHLLNDYEDLHRFFNLTRDLHMLMDGWND